MLSPDRNFAKLVLVRLRYLGNPNPSIPLWVLRHAYRALDLDLSPLSTLLVSILDPQFLEIYVAAIVNAGSVASGRSLLVKKSANCLFWIARGTLYILPTPRKKPT